MQLEALVSSICKNTPEIKAKENVEVTCTPFPSIRSSKLALTIVLRNLIENGIKYNDKVTPQITIRGNVEDGMARIQIADNGTGIEEKYFEEVFEMFKRVNTSYLKGSGLGLNISRNLIRRLGGEIFIAKSEVGVGTTFQVNFPVVMSD
ncbi:MAG: HAMP domain-containing sensor histidine kinase [Bacteroidota bacterium]